MEDDIGQIGGRQMDGKHVLMLQIYKQLLVNQGLGYLIYRKIFFVEKQQSSSRGMTKYTYAYSTIGKVRTQIHYRSQIERKSLISFTIFNFSNMHLKLSELKNILSTKN